MNDPTTAPAFGPPSDNVIAIPETDVLMVLPHGQQLRVDVVDAGAVQEKLAKEHPSFFARIAAWKEYLQRTHNVPVSSGEALSVWKAVGERLAFFAGSPGNTSGSEPR